MKIVTHDGGFHTDEVFAIALIKKFIKSNLEITRTREEKILEEAKKNRKTFVIDVGREYNYKNRNFDHHQRGFNFRWKEDNILKSSCGLIWNYLKKQGYLKKYSNDTLKNIENKLIKKIDLHDNGESFWSISNMIKICNREKNTIEDFNKAVELAYIYIDNIFYQENNTTEKLNCIFKKDLDKYSDNEIFFSSLSNNGAFLRYLSNETKAWILIYEQKEENNHSSRWYAKAITKYIKKDYQINNMKNFEVKSALAPESWRGLSNEELRVKTGMKNSIFVHKTGYLCVAKDKKTAIHMANAMVSNIQIIKSR